MQEEHRRILVPSHEYSLHPVNTVKSLIGLDVEIKSVKQHEIYREDGLVVVDVTYVSLDLNPIMIHFIKKDELKPISPDSSEHGVKINGLNVLVDMSSIEKDRFKDYYPIQIMRKDAVYDRKHFQYFGRVPTKVLGSLCTPLIAKNLCQFPEQVKLYPEGFSPKPDITESKMITSYKYELKKFHLLSGISNVSMVKSFSECKSALNGYLIKWEELKKQKLMQGVIIIQPNRIYDIVLFIPSPMFMITETDIENIDRFIEFSKINWLNYRYISREK